MTRIERHIDIDASAEEVFDVLTDLDLLPTWSTTTVETHGTPPKPLETGETFTQTLRVLGRTVDVRWTVSELQRPQKVAYTAESDDNGTLRMVQNVAERAGGSRVQLEIDYELPGGLLGDVLDSVYAERRNEREIQHSLENLKELVERRARR